MNEPETVERTVKLTYSGVKTIERLAERSGLDFDTTLDVLAVIGYKTVLGRRQTPATRSLLTYLQERMGGSALGSTET